MATKNAINNATQDFTIDPGASGDSFVQYGVNSVDKFRVGVDDTDSDAFKVSLGSALGTSDAFVMTANGENTLPLTPAFMANVSADDTNVTGDGTVATVIFDTERYDQNSDYNTTTGIFTAPVTGRYFLAACVKCKGLTASETEGEMRIVTSNSTFISGIQSSYRRNSSNELSFQYCVIADMDSSDTAKIDIVWSNGSLVVDIGGDGSDSISYFSGYLAC